MRSIACLLVIVVSSLLAKEYAIPKLPDGLAGRVVVKNPDVVDTCACAVSPDGRKVYISQHHSANGNGKWGDIKLAYDADGDGNYERLTEFAKEVGGGQGMLCVGETLYIVHSPYLTLFRDNDGDGVSDERKHLLEGIGPPYNGGLHDHTSSGLALATDGWIYISIGDWGAHKPKGTDGKVVQLYGGGILRCRPDGTDVEVYCRGLRNTMDVGIDPELNVFTRDNTNDGGGWNVRSTHIWQSGQYGYPNLFKNYIEEMLPCLEDHGGGSPTGCVFYCENGLREEDRGQLLFTDWGRAILYRYDLKRVGATYQMKQNEWIKSQSPFRAIDVQPDAYGNLYVADWGRGGWGKPEPAGAVIKISAAGAPPYGPPLPKFETLDVNALIATLAEPSQTRRILAQQELLKRGQKALPALLAVMEGGANVSRIQRVFALWTYKQIAQSGATPALLKLAEKSEFRELAFRAITDRKGELDGVSPEPFIKALKDQDAFVRAQAAVCLGRLGAPHNTDAVPALPPAAPVIAPRVPQHDKIAAALCEALGDGELQVRHVAMRSLRAMQAHEACLKTAEQGSPLAAQFALVALREIYSDGAVRGIVALAARVTDPARKAEVLKAIGRLARREDEWKGNWWGTQPVTAGPFQKFAAWTGSERLVPPLKFALADKDEQVVAAALWGLTAMRDASCVREVMEIAERPALHEAAMKMLIGSRSPDAVPFFKKTLLNTAAKENERQEALAALDKMLGANKERLPAAEVAIAEAIPAIEAEFTKPEPSGKPAQKKLGNLLSQARKVLSSLKSDEALPALRALMADAALDSETRALAAQAVTANKSPAARAAMAALLNDPNPELAALALHNVDPKGGVKVERVREMLKPENPKLYGAALVALGRLKDAASAELMATQLKNTAFQACAIEGLHAMGPAGGPVAIADTVERLLNLIEADEFETEQVRKSAIACMRAWLGAKELPDDTRKKLDQRAAGSGGIIATWHLLGPIKDTYPGNYENAYEIEKLKPDEILSYKMKRESETLEFKRHTTADERGVVTLNDVYSYSDNAAAFAYAEVTAAEDLKANFVFGSDDSLKVWVNGAQVWSRPGDRGINPDSDKFAAPLKKGKNIILAKVCNNGGGWALAGRVELPQPKKAPSKRVAQREALIADALARAGDAKKGESLFNDEKRAGCIRCHTVNGKGGNTGPDLSSIGATKEKRYLIDSVLDPSKDMAQGFQPMRIKLSSGAVKFGVILNQTADSFELATADAKRETIPEADAKEKSPVVQSIMPEGLADTLTRDEFLDLVAYLTSLKK